MQMILLRLLGYVCLVIDGAVLALNVQNHTNYTYQVIAIGCIVLGLVGWDVEKNT